MRYQTELMKEILTNEKAQEMIDYVSRIYGESYVGLWMFQAIGTAMGKICDFSEQLRYETSPVTATKLIEFWEDEYGIPADSSLTMEQRRNRIISKIRDRGACTPKRLAAAVSAALGGVPVEVTERTGKNTFNVNIRLGVPSIAPAVAVIEAMKPAHLIYTLQVARQLVSETDLKIAIAITHAEMYKVEVIQ